MIFNKKTIIFFGSFLKKTGNKIRSIGNNIINKYPPYKALKLDEIIKDLDYILFSEKNLKEFDSKKDFLIEAKNCAFSTNILCIPKEKLNSTLIKLNTTFINENQISQ